MIRVPYREVEKCCACGQTTDAGIYVRADPAEMPFHVADEDER